MDPLWFSNKTWCEVLYFPFEISLNDLCLTLLHYTSCIKRKCSDKWINFKLIWECLLLFNILITVDSYLFWCSEEYPILTRHFPRHHFVLAAMTETLLCRFYFYSYWLFSDSISKLLQIQTCTAHTDTNWEQTLQYKATAILKLL